MLHTADLAARIIAGLVVTSPVAFAAGVRWPHLKPRIAAWILPLAVAATWLWDGLSSPASRTVLGLIFGLTIGVIAAAAIERAVLRGTRVTRQPAPAARQRPTGRTHVRSPWAA